MPEYVYGVVAADVRLPKTEGIGGQPIRSVVGEDGVAAVVSDLSADEELRLGRDEVLTHSRVLGEVQGSGAVLPMQLGIVMDSDDEVRERLLEPHAPELVEQLEQFRGKFEANVRVVYEEDALMREVIASDPQIAELRQAIQGRDPDGTYYERIQLGELVAGAVERIREADEANLMSALCQVSLEQNVSPPAHERVALNAAFLLEQARAKEFDDVLEAIAEGQSGRLRFRYTGPLPPHSFVELAGAGS
ncbi:MAG TPA: GvpL/GvpF family gas vesicle protein [Solirubrobacteraceae bacterium]|nr:GvpL/GvpF family gas vesicle protein [Solirubrobacteraceae bacterium]